MTEIKLIDKFDNNFYYLFLNFCIKSKPYDFCSLKSINLRNLKIKEYFDFLLKECFVVKYSKSGIDRYTFFSWEQSDIVLQFSFGHFSKDQKLSMKMIHETIFFAMNNFDKSSISATITRKHKINKFLNWLKRYDHVGDLKLEKNNIQIIWTYERLSQDSWNK
jgi:hypothetical protein